MKKIIHNWTMHSVFYFIELFLALHIFTMIIMFTVFITKLLFCLYFLSETTQKFIQLRRDRETTVACRKSCRETNYVINLALGRVRASERNNTEDRNNEPEGDGYILERGGNLRESGIRMLYVHTTDRQK